MSVARPDEHDEWMLGRVESWVETYKKAMLTPALLHIVSTRQPVTIAALLDALRDLTGWDITERGLYRTVKRLQDSGFLASEHHDAPRTGAKRKVLTLSPLGARLLDGIDAHLIELPSESPR